MPANRSRTDNWRTCLEQIAQRGGALEIALKSAGAAGEDALAAGEPQRAGAADLIWRVKLQSVTDTEIVVDSPSAAGRTLTLGAGVDLVVSMTIGQNRWMFRSRTLGGRPSRSAGGPSTMVIAAPDHVERCTRRGFFRVSTAALNLPEVQCWPLLDPASVIAAESANRVMLTELMNGAGNTAAPAEPDGPESLLLPIVGPMFRANLLNLSGGGLGVIVDPAEGGTLQRQRFVWMRIDLAPHLPAPLALTTRLVHAHPDSSQKVYGGFTFDFSFNPGHQRFVIDLMSDYIRRVQVAQHQAAAARRAAQAEPAVYHPAMSAQLEHQLGANRFRAAIAIDVLNLERSTAFYTGMLGFRVISTHREGQIYASRLLAAPDAAGSAASGGGGDGFGLVLREAFGRRPVGCQSGGLLRISLRVPAAAGGVAALARRLVDTVSWHGTKPDPESPGLDRLIFLDPDGYLIEVFA